MPPFKATNSLPFSRYQKSVVAILAFLQFVVILDFMLMSPLGAVIIPALHIGATQFGLLVSAYAFSACISGLLTAGFADRFDRKKLLLFFYTGFVLGTLWCGVASSFETLLLARIVTGLFGGVIGSVVLSIATDLFPVQMRGRVMSFIQTAFAASQVLGLPVGLYLSNHWNWQAPFLAMAALGLVGGFVVAWCLQPVTDHLALPRAHSPWMHLFHTLKEKRYLIAFLATGFLTTGGFMLMPFASSFLVNNVGINLHSLPLIYLITGISTIFIGPLIGKATDAIGKFKVFSIGTVVSIVMVLLYTHLGPISLSLMVLINVIMFAGLFSRMVPFQALMSTVPVQSQRGSFNAINASLQQLAGGVASMLAGHIVGFSASGQLLRFDVVGYVVAGTSLIAIALLWRLMRHDASGAEPEPAREVLQAN